MFPQAKGNKYNSKHALKCISLLSLQHWPWSEPPHLPLCPEGVERPPRVLEMKPKTGELMQPTREKILTNARKQYCRNDSGWMSFTHSPNRRKPQHQLLYPEGVERSLRTLLLMRSEEQWIQTNKPVNEISEGTEHSSMSEAECNQWA
jgi:hypothetical protein